MLAFQKPLDKNSGKIREVEIGAGDAKIVVGGENVLPFYGFDGEIPNKPVVAMEVMDFDPKEEWVDACYAPIAAVATDPVAWAKLCVEKGADLVTLRLLNAHPDRGNVAAEECAALAKKVAEAINVPLIVEGCGHTDRDAEILPKVAEALEGKNYLILAANEHNYKAVGAAAGLAYGNLVGAESAVDINLAKQLNILLTQLGVKEEKIIIHPGVAAVGYGFEYVYSAMERIRAAAIQQNDKTLQMPFVSPYGDEAWKTKEATAPVDEVPAWGDAEPRGIAMEVTGAISLLLAGAHIVILRHPTSVATVKKAIAELL